MKYTGEYLVTFAEVPDEVTLCINISNCPYRCPGCHSPWLQEDYGQTLTPEILQDLVDKNDGITCVCFMGGSEDDVLDLVRTMPANVKKAWYTGQDYLPDSFTLAYLDYVKIGPYKRDLGPLTSKTTNQRLYQIFHYSPDMDHIQNSIKDITSRFWKE